MGRVHHQHGVEFEAHRPRLDGADTGQQQRRQHLAVGEAVANAKRDFLEQFRARRVFEQTHQRLDVGLHAGEIGVEFGVRGGNRSKLGEKGKVGEAIECRAGSGLNEAASRGSGRHGNYLPGYGEQGLQIS